MHGSQADPFIRERSLAIVYRLDKARLLGDRGCRGPLRKHFQVGVFTEAIPQRTLEALKEDEVLGESLPGHNVLDVNGVIGEGIAVGQDVLLRAGDFGAAIGDLGDQHRVGPFRVGQTEQVAGEALATVSGGIRHRAAGPQDFIARHNAV